MAQATFAQRLGVSRLTVSEIVQEKWPVSVKIAIQLGKLLGNVAGLGSGCIRRLMFGRLNSLEGTRASNW